MKVATLYRIARAHPILSGKTNHLQYRCFQQDFVPRDPKSKPERYKYPVVYDPYGLRPPPSDKIVQLAENIASLPLEERMLIGPALWDKVMHPKLESISVEGIDLGTQGTHAGSSKAEEKKDEKTTFDVKLEKFDAGAKLKVIQEIRSFIDLGLREAKDLVEKTPLVLKQQVTKD